MRKKLVKSIVVAALIMGILISMMGCGTPSDKNSYFEKNNLKATNKTTYSVPVYMGHYLYGTKSGFLFTLVEWDLKKKYKTKLESVKTEPSDKDGYVTTTIVASCVIPIHGRICHEVGISYDYTITTYDFFDYYTGLSFPFSPISDEELHEENEIISYEGKDYDISYTKQNIWSTDKEIDWTQVEIDGIERCTTTFTFTYPKEYDGLMGIYSLEPDSRNYDVREEDMANYVNVPREVLSDEYLEGRPLDTIRYFYVK